MKKLIDVSGNKNIVRDFETKAILNSNSGEADIAQKRKRMLASLEYLSALPVAIEKLNDRINQLETQLKGKQ